MNNCTQPGVYVHKLDNLEEMDQFQENYTPPNLIHVKIKKYIYLNRPI